MIDNGYSLLDMELVNWGNFHGYQKFSLRQSTEVGGLFAPPQASAILGVNGSGKTTLIDALMIVLLPFETSVKLGVTNDYEKGSGGGRSIRDYVLGKYSSSVGHTADLDQVYGRNSGCSILLLRFQHNNHLKKTITLGRIWWYSKYKVSDTPLGFLSFDSLSIKDFCVDGRLPKSPKAFKAQVKALNQEIQIFETLQAYFSALSGAFGGVKKDDLKLLNRAFYVKSISQIDSFIKENMLLMMDNPHLERLLENVRNGQEIAQAIEACERKISSICRIIKELDGLRKWNTQVEQFRLEQSLLELLPDFIELEDFRCQLRKDKEDVEMASARRPDLQRQLDALEVDLSTYQSLLSKNEAQSQINLLEKQIHHLQEKILWSLSLFQKWEDVFKRIKVKVPKASEDQPKFVTQLESAEQKLVDNLEKNEIELEESRQIIFDLDRQSKELKDEIDHLSQSGSLIPQRIYEIKERAIRELKIPEKEIRFFSELVQVKKQFEQHRLPVEAVFFGVARNLLCHPKHLKKLTNWLEKTGFKADITVKRITDEEILTVPSPPQGRDERSILNFIEVLPEEEHPFSNYIRKWCEDVFDYCLVEVKQFSRQQTRLVTSEGLIKNDSRTMKKLKKNFPFSLGWSTQEIISQKSEQLAKWGLEYQSRREVLQKKEQAFAMIQTDIRLIRTLLKSQDDILLLCSANELKEQKEKSTYNLDEMKQNQPELESLKIKIKQVSQANQAVRQQLASIESSIKEKLNRIENTEKILPLREESFLSSRMVIKFINIYKSAELLIEELKKRDLDLKAEGTSRLERTTELSEKIRQLEYKKNSGMAKAGTLLADHRRAFADPGVSYQLVVEKLGDLSEEWVHFRNQLEGTELPQAKAKWRKFFDQVLIDSVKDTLNEIKTRLSDVAESIESINDVLKITNFEELPDEKRYLQIIANSSIDDRIRRFRKTMQSLEAVLGPSVRMQDQGQSEVVMSALAPFVEEFQKEPHYREFVTDVRNHFQFQVHSLRRTTSNDDPVVEVFSGAKKDAKSSAQTTQLAYALLASSLAYRFKFHDPVMGKETLRLIILDEFGGKFDNEKPREIVKLFNKMGFQTVLLSPMSKADLLAESIGQMILVHKISASQSKVKSFDINSLDDYQRLLNSEKPKTAPGSEMAALT